MYTRYLARVNLLLVIPITYPLPVPFHTEIITFYSRDFHRLFYPLSPVVIETLHRYIVMKRGMDEKREESGPIEIKYQILNKQSSNRIHK